MNYFDLAQRVIADTATAAALPTVALWAVERVVQVQNMVQGESLQREGVFTIPARINGGLATVNQDERAVAFDADAQAVLANIDLVGRTFRVTSQREYYQIVAAAPDGSSITLASDFVTANEADAGYEIVKPIHRLDPRARHASSFRTRYGLLREIGKAQLDLIDPERYARTGIPHYWAPVGRAVDGAILVEIFPWAASDPVQTHYNWWDHPAESDMGDEIPVFIDATELKAAVIADVAGWEQAKAAQAGNVEASGIWLARQRDELRKWRKYVKHITNAGRTSPHGMLVITRPQNPTRRLFGDQRDLAADGVF